MGSPENSDKLHVIVILADAGGGHRATAEALREILNATNDYRVTLVNPCNEVFPHLDWFARWTKRNGESTYNELILRRGRTGLFCIIFYLLIVLNIRANRHLALRAFSSFWEQNNPDLVISVVPFINELIVDSLAERVPQAACTILMTDWQELSRYHWFPRGTNYFAICGTEPSFEQLATRPHPADRLFRTSGLLIRPAFFGSLPKDVGAARRELELDPDRPVACMLYGSYGGRRMLQLASTLRDDPLDVQMIFLCGHDTELAHALRTAGLPFPTVVEEFTTRVPHYLALSDIFIGKPGPGSVSEALALNLSLLLDRHHALPQERPLLRSLADQRIGTSFRTPVEFHKALARLCADSSRVHRSSLRAPPPNAASEIPAIIAKILARHRQS